MASADLMQLYRISEQYYLQGKTQDEISRRENLSRSQISRILSAARDAGIVRIQVTLPEYADEAALASVLREHLELKDVIIATLPEGTADSAQITEAIAKTAASSIPKIIKNLKTVGIGWGHTMYRMSRLLTYHTAECSTLFVPLIGASGVDNPNLQINSIIDLVSEHMNARSFFANLPCFREKSIPLTSYENKRLTMLHEYWNELDGAIFGLGTKESSQVFFDEEVSLDAKEEIMRSRVIGDILSQFFYPDGRVLLQLGNFHLNAFPVTRLSALPRSICLAGGLDKVPAILTAARAGYFNTLITDSRTAFRIYERIRSELKT